MSRGRMHVLIAGGGVAALEAALALQALGDDRVEVELLAPDPMFWYRPLAVAEPFGLGAARHYELARLAAAAGATTVLGALARVDVDRRIAATAVGAEIHYDALLVATGATPVAAVPGALTFRGPADTAAIEALLAEIESEAVDSVVFAVPPGATWTVAAYELALLTASWASERDLDFLELAIATPEMRPLDVFGDASDSVARLLDRAGIRLHVERRPLEAHAGELVVVGGDSIPADRVVALPRLQGRYVEGLLQTSDGFLETDAHGRVVAAPHVYAAGDATTFPVKQGGIATQQAEAAAEALAASAGAPVRPRRFRPVLRGLLITGDEPLYLRRDLGPAAGDAMAAVEPLWWPAAKIMGRRLAPFLARVTQEADAASIV